MDEMQNYQTEEPIMALATPMAESAVAMIRTSGKGAISLFKEIFKPWKKLEGAGHKQAVFGKLMDPASGVVVDEVVALVYRDGGGYTGEEAVELMGHGSLPGIQMILKLLSQHGFRQALPGEFTFRAFMNGKLDLTQAEAVHELVKSKSKRGHETALNRLAGTLAKQIDGAKELLIRASSVISLQLDYPGDEIDDEVHLPIVEVREAVTRLKKLLESYEAGKWVREGVRIALCGKTNSGKSSLFNLFLKEDRSIVSNIHGTTRDYLEAWVSLKGLAVQLYDTAGIRQTDDPIEAEGIRRAKEVIDSADLVLYLIDGKMGANADELEEISYYGDRCLTLWNKIDDPLAHRLIPPDFVGLSAKTGEGFSALVNWVEKRLTELLKGRETDGAVVIDSLRQKEWLEHAVEALNRVLEEFEADESGLMLALDGIAVEMKEALDALGQLTGEVTSADILNEMFSSFCLGK